MSKLTFLKVEIIITPFLSVTWSVWNHSSSRKSYYYQCWKQLCCL